MKDDYLINLKFLPLEALKLERTSFSCSVEPLDTYFHKYVSQDVKKGLAKCFVLINEQQAKIIGYYTLSALSIPITDIPQEQIKKGIPYPNIPAVLIGRLAIDTHFQHQGYGKFIIADTIYRIQNNNIAAAVLVVDAKNDTAVSFYQRLGFIEFKTLNQPHKKFFYPLTKIMK
ncbi:GNAT family N-acetyltransferase [Mergibacter septicus]|uniref:GNAT family N-acetyltransferase n=1 Tax=Mergibacter septicus TaxID=221402 RepID=A0A8E3S8Q6_9PAST|nr:GNAT family N-acetyltransferase [Mergibacter septicus]AWX15494.1 GNAT family N-acetyltransferase [Mergibacter septicus]QDJ14747.1 GNAT family N-acetyltransferase [Mergibacter septicus]UTU47825.1 GNAT family N-acetyltransferase [Mergibacter septicus]WMR96569.1 GNAT family N-acetyltransferase [Mergibacter septicus]